MLRSLGASTLNVRGRATLAGASLPAYQAEALGGEGRIRGYEDNELGRAHSSLAATVELVLPVGVPPPSAGPGAPMPPVSLCFFGDAGGGTVPVLQNAPSAFSIAKGAAAGVGLRYGPIKIDYAINAKGELKTHVGLVTD